MDFRWAVGIALWTMLIGPIFGPPLPRATEQQAAASSATARPISGKPAPSLAP
jgi:hypothetical protein